MASINITFKPEPITEITSTISQTAFTSTNQTITINYSIINPVGNTEFIIDDQANIYWQNNEVSANNYIATIRYDTYVAIAKTINITISNNNVVKQYAISLCTNPNPEYTVTFSSTGTVLNKNGTTSITITAVVLKDNVVDTGHQNLFSWDSDFPIPSNIYKLSNYNTILEKNITVSQTNSTCKISIKNSNLPT
jgi:hypothetical protein